MRARAVLSNLISIIQRTFSEGLRERQDKFTKTEHFRLELSTLDRELSRVEDLQCTNGCFAATG
jgi:hypothetical protein